MFKIFIFITFACVTAFPSPDAGLKDEAVRVKKDCANGILNPTCLKLSAISLIEKLSNKDEVTLIPGVSLVKDGEKGKYDDVAAELARSLSEPEDRLDKFLLYQVSTFLDTHSVKLKLLDDASVEDAKNMIGEGRAKNSLGMGGKKGGMGSLIAMAMMMKGQ